VGTAGLSAIFNLSNPRATAAAVVAATLGSALYRGAVSHIIIDSEVSLLFAVAAIPVGLLAGYQAGKMVDPEFGKIDAGLSWFFAANAANHLASLLDIQE